jgi:hypothetical protein
MNEREFIKKLQERAREQEKLIRDMPMHRVFYSVSFWFGNHPWRILIPTAIILTIIFHFALGKGYDEFVLKLFGKL